MTIIGKIKTYLNKQEKPEENPDTKNRRHELEGEQTTASLTSVRQPVFSDTVLSTLTPSRLRTIRNNLKIGEVRDYLTLAEELEDSDPHYRSVLSSRKNQVTSIKPSIITTGDSDLEQKMADDIKRDIIDAPWFSGMEYDLLDALGKGYSVCEIIWKRTPDKWFPSTVKWKDPRYYRYDRDTMERIVLDEAGQEMELIRDKYVIHQPKMKSGHQMEAGLALVVAYYYLIKNAGVASWAAFAQTYGYPLRIGRYGRNASQKDKEVLRRALANLGRDVGAVIPDAMKVEIINAMSSGSGNIQLYENLADWVDKQVSKAVLGQTMSADAEGGQYKGDLHNEIRLEIKKADAAQLAATIQRDLIIPYINFNYGVQEEYPQLIIPVLDPEDVPALVDSVEKLVQLGFKVKTDDLYPKLGLNKPDENDEVLSPPSLSSPMVESNRSFVELNSESEDSSSLDELVEEELDDWMEIAGPIKEAVENFIKDCSSYDEVKKRIHELEAQLEQLPGIADRIAMATFKARCLGQDEAFKEED